MTETNTDLSYIDHTTRGVERTVTYFKSKENYIRLLEIFLEELQEVEEAFNDLSKIKDVDSVVGIWLDYIGKIVGEPRKSREDEEYRLALQLKISINTSEGTAPAIREIISTYTKSDKLRLAEGIVSWGHLIFNGVENSGSDLLKLLQDIIPVTTSMVVMQDTENKCFFPAWELRLSSLEVFEVFDGTVTETLNLVLTEGGPPSPFFVSLDGVVDGYDQDTEDNCFLEWESPVDFRLHNGELLELKLTPTSDPEPFRVNGVVECTVDEVLAPWEITPECFVVDTQPTVVEEDVTAKSGIMSRIDLTSYGSTIRSFIQPEFGEVFNGTTTSVWYNPPTSITEGDSFKVYLYNNIIVEVLVEVEVIEVVAPFTGVNIGDAVISGEEEWEDVNGLPTFDLLLADQSAVNPATHPILHSIYEDLPLLTTETGSPFPYKIVADYTGT